MVENMLRWAVSASALASTLSSGSFDVVRGVIPSITWTMMAQCRDQASVTCTSVTFRSDMGKWPVSPRQGCFYDCRLYARTIISPAGAPEGVSQFISACCGGYRGDFVEIN